MSPKQSLAISFGVLALLAGGARAAEPPRAEVGGFYGGISLRNAGQEGEGVSLGRLSSAWGRFTLPMADDAGSSRTLAYGGYRFANDLALEAAVATSDRFSLQPGMPGARRGVGLALTGDGESSKTWNVDVYTAWEFRKSMSLYGRLGYAQSEAASYAPGFLTDVRRPNRDGMSYGLGLRYDMSPALGLRLEYARFSRLPGELAAGALMPENDQLQFGMQFRF